MEELQKKYATTYGWTYCIGFGDWGLEMGLGPQLQDEERLLGDSPCGVINQLISKFGHIMS